MIKEFISKLRNYKLTYITYNFFHRKKLAHNKSLYKEYHIHKPLFWSVNSEDFAGLPQSKPWLDMPEAETLLEKNNKFLQLPDVQQELLRTWIKDGAIILKNFLTEKQADEINETVDRLLKEKKLHPLQNGKIMFAFKQSVLINTIIHDERIIDLFQFILQQPIIPFQTINFLKGSQQRAHSDSIHMTTYPLGYLAAAWFALEDIDESNGALFYYPGSHRLPYLLNPGFNTAKDKLVLNHNTNQQYEEKLQKIIESEKLIKKDFFAGKGDVFLWHANLIHGGNAITNEHRTRKSMVAHYFAKDVIKYHEISQRPALIDPAN